MHSGFARAAMAAAFGATLLGAAGAANATIVNISATSGFTEVTLPAGVYKLEFIGRADGGDFDAWNGACPNADCASGWSNAFGTSDAPPAPGGTINLYNFGPTYSSALASLAAAQGAASIPHGQSTAGVPGSFQLQAPIDQPWIAFIDGTASRLFVLDADGDLTNNAGGVSLRLTAVPEPGAWAMMLVGFGALGAAMRRRRAALA